MALTCCFANGGPWSVHIGCPVMGRLYGTPPGHDFDRDSSIEHAPLSRVLLDLMDTQKSCSHPIADISSALVVGEFRRFGCVHHRAQLRCVECHHPNTTHRIYNSWAISSVVFRQRWTLQRSERSQIILRTNVLPVRSSVHEIDPFQGWLEQPIEGQTGAAPPQHHKCSCSFLP